MFPLRIAAACSLLLLASAAGAASGSYGADAAGQAVHARNVYYYAHFAAPPATPADGRISGVSYRWQFSAQPEGLRVYLCLGSQCLDVSKQPQGSSDAFNGARSNQPFRLKYQLPGRGGMAPLFPGRQQLAVSYTLP